MTLESPHAEERGRKDPMTGDAPQWAQDRAKELLKTAPQDMVLWMVLAHGLAQERTAAEPGIMRALQIVGEYLRAEYVVEECKGHRVMGCASCEAIALLDDLEALGQEIMDEAHHRYPADWRREQQKDETR